MKISTVIPCPFNHKEVVPEELHEYNSITERWYQKNFKNITADHLILPYLEGSENFNLKKK